MNEFVPDEHEAKKEDSLMWEYLQQEEYDYKQPKRGDICEGVVLSKKSDEILVDVGLKLEAVVPRRDLEKLGPEALENVHQGDTVTVFVLQPENKEGRLVASLNMARTLKDWQKAQEMMESGELHEATVANFNKGGVIVPFYGLRGFVPASQLVKLPQPTGGGPRIDRLNEMVGQELKLKVIEVDRRRRRLIMSERAAMREWRKEQKERLLRTLQPGDVCHGTVTNLMNFGAFVDLGGADGLVHVSEISWQRVRHPRDVLSVSQEVDVYVLNVDQERERIALSIKKLQPEPWSQVDQNYTVGDLIYGEITNVTDFGAFARLAEGVEGLIHVSELDDGPVDDPRKVVNRGAKLSLRIISMDVERRRIGLSLKRALPEEEPEHEAETEAVDAPVLGDEAVIGEAPELVESSAADADEGATEDVLEAVDATVSEDAVVAEMTPEAADAEGAGESEEPAADLVAADGSEVEEILDVPAEPTDATAERTEDAPAVGSAMESEPPEMDEQVWHGLMEEAPPTDESEDLPVPVETSNPG